jgi:hypothetical protein
MTGLTRTDDVLRLSNQIPPLPTTAEGLKELQQVVDRAVRISRDQYWCERLEDALKVTVPQMAAADGHFYASDDMDCRKKQLGVAGDKAFNANGYNSNGVDRDGFDRYGNPPPDPDTGNGGLMPNGFTRAYDKDGLDCLGIGSGGYDRDGNRRRGRGPTPEEEAVDHDLINPTTAVLGPDGKLHKKGTVFAFQTSPDAPTPPVKVAKKAAPRKATTVKGPVREATLEEIMKADLATNGAKAFA